jgi:hypothetical protein
MGKLKPIGSERLEGMEKINRIIEISRYKENIPNPVNEVRSTEYGIMLADGNTYKIERDKNGYVIKKSINESEMEYLEPMQNRKYYPSYSQALKRLNLITKEVNTLVGNEENISLFGEQKKFTLKTPKPAPAEAPPMPAPAPAPAPAPTDMPPMPDAGMDMPEDPSMGDEGMDMPEDPEMGDEGMDMGDEGMDMPEEPEGDEGMVTFKSIQKLTGKLGQKIRKLNQGDEPISSDDTKYVINSILSALDLSQLSDEDVEEIMTRFEDNEDMGDEDMDMPEEPEMGDEDLPEGEMREEWEGTMDGDYDLGFRDKPKRMKHPKSPMEEMNFDKALTNKHSELIKSKMGDMLEDKHVEGMGGIFDEIFSESKVDKILSKYFQESPNEKRLNEERGVRKFVEKKTHKVKQMKEVKRLSESIDQEVTSEKFMTRYSKAELIGKTNKRNLVFEVNGKQFKITPDGAIL